MVAAAYETVMVDGIYPAEVISPLVNDKGLVLVKFPSNGATRWIRASRLPEGVAVWATVEQERAFLLRWLADDLRELSFERGGTTLATRRLAYDSDPETAHALMFNPHVGGTRTLEMFRAMGWSGSRHVIADRIGRFLAGKTNAQLEALADAMREAWDGDTFRWDRVSARTLRRVGLSARDFRSPMSLPRFDADPAEIVGRYFPEAVQIEGVPF